MFSFNAPVLFAMSPMPVPYDGGVVTVSGENFGSVAHQVAVLVDGVVVSTAQILTISDSTVTFTLPAGEDNHLLSLRVGPSVYTATSTPISFFYDIPPLIGMCE